MQEKKRLEDEFDHANRNLKDRQADLKQLTTQINVSL